MPQIEQGYIAATLDLDGRCLGLLARRNTKSTEPLTTILRIGWSGRSSLTQLSTRSQAESLWLLVAGGRKMSIGQDLF